MKYIAVLGILLMVCCQSPKEEIVTGSFADDDPIEGVWRMTKLMGVYHHNGDTVDETRNQHKIFVDGSIMWGFEAEEDSTEWFGYGTYELKEDSLIETMTSGSNAFRKAISEHGSVYRMGLKISDEEFTQVYRDDSMMIYEMYVRVQ